MTNDPKLSEDARQMNYLRLRNTQLTDDVVALQAEVQRLRQIVDRLHGRKAAQAPNPLSGGQHL
jgi:hypothetical protein